jgi:DNA-binding transcriptional regulator YdaS (Cro superfamily)
MRLDIWLRTKRITITDFAESMDMSRGHIQKICSGILKPSSKLARNIEKATNGEVTAKELLGE